MSSGLYEFVQKLTTKCDETQQGIDELHRRRVELKSAMTRIATGLETRHGATLTADDLKAFPNYRAANAELRAVHDEIDAAKEQHAGLDEHLRDRKEDLARDGHDSELLNRIRAKSSGDNLQTTRHIPTPPVNTAAPLSFDPEQLRSLHEAAMRKETRSVRVQRDFSTVPANMPVTQLWPSVLGPS